MEKLVSSWSNAQLLPENYIFPPEKRPGNHVAPVCSTIPVIDLNKIEGLDRISTVLQLLEASQEFGIFQVINHGVPENLVNESMSVFKEVFEMSAEDQASLYSEDPNKICKLYTSSVHYATEDTHFWRDNLRHPCHPLDQSLHLWPEKPTRYREVVKKYVTELKKLGSRILELISEGLGLESGYFVTELSKDTLLSVNNYPLCPDPSVTLGLPRHHDANLITILLQDSACGLQVFRQGEWFAVEPLHNAFVVNIGYQLQIMSNNKLKSVEHRVVTNTKEARTTAAFFINPSKESIIEPAKSLITTLNPPLYRAFEFKEFLANYISVTGDNERAIEPFRLKA